MQELPLILPDGRSATSKIDMTYTSDPSVPTGAIRGNFNQEKRRKSVKGSPYRRTGPGREMENVICYTNPAADQPKVYSQRLDKSKWCCPGCRYSKRKVELSLQLNLQYFADTIRSAQFWPGTFAFDVKTFWRRIRGARRFPNSRAMSGRSFLNYPSSLISHRLGCLFRKSWSSYNPLHLSHWRSNWTMDCLL